MWRSKAILILSSLSCIIDYKFCKPMDPIAGHTIPAGWIVVVAPSVLHYDPQIYEKTCEFNPWR